MSKLLNNLYAHYERCREVSLNQFFLAQPERFDQFSCSFESLFLDYSKNHLDLRAQKDLLEYARSLGLSAAIEALFSGEKINYTENRAALHPALRAPRGVDFHLEGEKVSDGVHHVLDQLEQFTDAIRKGEWRGGTGKPIKDIVNLGVGGSDLGPKMVTEALSPYWHDSLRCHFVSNVGGEMLARCVRELNPETTLFIVSSKSFTTLETLSNFEWAKKWLCQSVNETDAHAHHLVAVTAAPKKANALGFTDNTIFRLWDWVGGRYSLWSATGLPIVLMIGMKNFRELLAGAHAMDRHFQETSFEKNMPVMLALVSFWWIHFFGYDAHALTPYSTALHHFRAHVQQLDMESNGKSVRHDGSIIESPTAPIIWGEVGCNSQHSFYQSLHQGRKIVPVEFILPIKNHYAHESQQQKMIASCLAQSQALMKGKSLDEVKFALKKEGLGDEAIQKLAPFKVCEGNRPSTTLLLDKVTPRSLGSLVALYEHKVFVQGVLWQINSFDQWGVELGKQLSQSLQGVEQGKDSPEDLDASTAGLFLRAMSV
jgi:glucose-6-phosphate isomerase